jgi:O-antigen/teichoic acid export membrane protein
MAATGQPLHNVLWLVAERVLRIAVTAVVLALVARHLQPAGFGQLGFALSFTGLFTPLAFFGLEGLLVRDLIRRPDQGGALLGTACVLRLGAGAVSMAVCLALAFGLPGLRSDAWFIVALSPGFLWQCVEVTDMWFQRHLQSRRTATVRFTAVMIGSAVKVWLVWRKAPAVWFAWEVRGEVLLFELGLLFAYARMPEKVGRWRVESVLAAELARRAWPLALAGLLLALQGRLDQFIVKASLSETETGAYFAAVRLVELPLFVTSAISVSIFPALAASRALGVTEFAVHAQRMFDLLCGFAWVSALGLSLIAWWVVPWLFGAAYAGAVPSLVVLAWGLLPWAGSFARQQCILANHPTWLQMAAALTAIAVQVPVALWLVPRLGGPGAALASGLSTLVGGWLTSFVLPGLRESAGWQGRAFLIPFAPGRWRAALTLLR